MNSDSDSNLSDMLPSEGSRTTLNLIEPKPMASCKCPLWVAAVAIGGIILAVVILIAVPVARNQILHRSRSYVVMVDAGSSSTKLYVFSWRAGSRSEETPEDIKQEFFNQTKKGGVSDYTDKPEKASEEIVQILKANVLDTKPDGSPPIIPEKVRDVTPIYMGATAGMRLVEARDPVAYKRLMGKLRSDFSALGLLVKNATRQIRVITGDEEALAGWIATNYLSDTLRKTSVKLEAPQAGTIGALDMGGASAQVSFVTKAPVGLEVTSVTLYEQKLNVYQHSFLCFGKGTARQQMFAGVWKQAGKPQTTKRIPNPCSHPGMKETLRASQFLIKPCFIAIPGEPMPKDDTQFTFEGTGNYAECAKITSELFKRKKCTHSRCSFENIFQPELPPGKFVAFSSYYFAMKFFNVTKKNTSRGDLRQVLKEYCKRPWISVSKQYSVPTRYLKGYCFDGIYIDQILMKLGFDNTRWKDISFIGKIGKRKMSWPLGYMLKESADVPPGEATYKVSEPAYQGLVSVFVIVLLACLGLLLMFLLIRHCSHRYSPASNTEEVA